MNSKWSTVPKSLHVKAGNLTLLFPYLLLLNHTHSLLVGLNMSGWVGLAGKCFDHVISHYEGRGSGVENRNTRRKTRRPVLQIVQLERKKNIFAGGDCGEE